MTVTVSMSFVCLTAIIVALTFKVIDISSAPKDSDEKRDAMLLCHSFGPIAVSLTWILLAVSMTLLTNKIRKCIVTFNEQLKDSILHSDSAESGHAVSV